MLKLSNLFQSGMILQRDKPVIIWGFANPESSIFLSVQGQRLEVTSDERGEWIAELKPLSTSVSETMVIQSETDRIELTDIVVGEVFVAAGQSNMEFWMRYERHYPEIRSSCLNPMIRFYDMPKLSFPGQEKKFNYSRVGLWRKATPEDLEFFSSVGYYFARKLAEDFSIPIGIIGCNFGGTMSLAWMKEEHARQIQPEQTAAFERKLNGKSLEAFYEAAMEDPGNDTGNSNWSAFNDFILPRTPSMEEIEAFLGDTALTDIWPHPQDAPGALYEHMVKKLAPFTARAVLWYQGESDDAIEGTQHHYHAALNAIKEDWREAWGDEHLPFFIVQLPGFRSWFVCECRGFPVIRECQRLSAAQDPAAYLCSISDSGEEYDIHPKDKLVVGIRLALLAERHLFGASVEADPPECISVQMEGNRLTMCFDHVGKSLHLKGESLQALTVEDVAGTIPYKAEIFGNCLVLTLTGEAELPLQIRFAQTPWYCVNLYNEAGIPAIPFEKTITHDSE